MALMRTASWGRLAQVSAAARIPEDTTAASSHAFEELTLEIAIPEPGFLYIYVSNENEESVTAYFDDLSTEHALSPVTYAVDYYPFGLPQEGRKHERTKYRYGYQGDYSEEDPETGFNHFEARDYDPVIGRWTAVDPKRQFFSPYVGMGNNPVSGTDPDGGGVLTDIYDKDTGAKLMHIEDGIDQAIAMSSSEFGSFLMVGQLNNFAANLIGIDLGTNTNFELISKTIYHEAGYISPLAEESAAIYDVLENRSMIRNKSVVDVIKTEGVYGYNLFKTETDYTASRLKTAQLGTIMGMISPNDVKDYSGGSYFWDAAVFLDNPNKYKSNYFNKMGHGTFVGTASKNITFSHTIKVGATQFMNYNKSTYPNKIYP